MLLGDFLWRICFGEISCGEYVVCCWETSCGEYVVCCWEISCGEHVACYWDCGERVVCCLGDLLWRAFKRPLVVNVSRYLIRHLVCIYIPCAI